MPGFSFDFLGGASQSTPMLVNTGTGTVNTSPFSSALYSSLGNTAKETVQNKADVWWERGTQLFSTYLAYKLAKSYGSVPTQDHVIYQSENYKPATPGAAEQVAGYVPTGKTVTVGASGNEALHPSTVGEELVKASMVDTLPSWVFVIAIALLGAAFIMRRKK